MDEKILGGKLNRALARQEAPPIESLSGIACFCVLCKREILNIKSIFININIS